MSLRGAGSRGRQPRAGSSLCYAFVYKGRWFAVATWSSATFHLKDRDQFIKWTPDLPLVLAMDRSKNIIARFTKRPHLDLQMSGKDGALLTLTGEFTGAYHVLRSSGLAGWSEML